MNPFPLVNNASSNNNIFLTHFKLKTKKNVSFVYFFSSVELRTSAEIAQQIIHAYFNSSVWSWLPNLTPLLIFFCFVWTIYSTTYEYCICVNVRADAKHCHPLGLSFLALFLSFSLSLFLYSLYSSASQLTKTKSINCRMGRLNLSPSMHKMPLKSYIWNIYL